MDTTSTTMHQPPPAEITAEWTVHAQLTIVRGDPRLKSPTAATPDNNRESVLMRSDGNQHIGCSEQCAPASLGVGNSDASTLIAGDGPLRVVYKWSTDDIMKTGSGGAGGTNGRDFYNFGSRQSKPQSFTSSTASDSGCCQPHLPRTTDVDRSNVGDPNAKCRSSCSIVLTACTDLYPTTVGGDGRDSMAPPQYNTTATCVVTPLPGEIHRHQPKTSTTATQFLSVKDAFCQTSDGEFKAKSEPRTHSGQPQPHPQQHHHQRTRSQRAYDYRRATESMLIHSSSLLSPNVSFEDGTPNASLSRQPSHSPVLIRQVSTATSRTHSPGPNVRVHHSSSKVTHQHHHHQHQQQPLPLAKATPATKKSPRTVHIDVYCTGSEAEDSDCSSSSPSSSCSTSSEAARNASHPGFHINDDDAASNSTPQTVFDANQMRLHHSRVTNRRELPRRLATAASKESHSLPTQPGQLRQFILDQANAADKDEINESKQMLFSKHMGAAGHVTQPPALTKFSFSGHPGSFQQADPSEGGFSSNYANSSRSTFRDATCSSISSAMASSSAVADDLEHYGNLSGGDSFEYAGQEWPLLPSAADPLNTATNKGWRSPEKERKFLLRQRKMLDFVQQNQQQMREQTEDREEDSPPVMPNAIYNNVSGGAPRRHHRVLFTPNYEGVEEGRSWVTIAKRSPALAAIDSAEMDDEVEQGASRRRATPFGARVEMTRKKHFGPAKNPDCLCEHCRRWLADRAGAQLQTMRGRAASMGEEQMVAKRSSFWLMRQ